MREKIWTAKPLMLKKMMAVYNKKEGVSALALKVKPCLKIKPKSGVISGLKKLVPDISNV